jgi:hypothetical protein
MRFDSAEEHCGCWQRHQSIAARAETILGHLDKLPSSLLA